MVEIQDGPNLEMGFALTLRVPLGIAGAGLPTVAKPLRVIGHGGLNASFVGGQGITNGVPLVV